VIPDWTTIFTLGERFHPMMTTIVTAVTKTQFDKTCFPQLQPETKFLSPF
jgi:hypothetical protein